MAKQIPLTKGFFTRVDYEDYEWLNQWKWHAMVLRRGNLIHASRADRGPDGKQHPRMMQRCVLNTPIGVDVDHINCSSLDNR